MALQVSRRPKAFFETPIFFVGSTGPRQVATALLPAGSATGRTASAYSYILIFISIGRLMSLRLNEEVSALFDGP